MKVVVCGGHVTCALAVIEELKKRQGIEIFFLGRLHPMEGDNSLGLEYQLISSAGIPFYPIITGRLQRKFTRYTIPSLFKIPIGFFQSLGFFLKIKPDVVCSFGSYLAVPPVLAAWFLRIPVITHEQTTVSGLSNKIIAKFAKIVAVSWTSSLSHFPQNKVILTGNPIREEVFKSQGQDKISTASKDKLPMIYITGGNQGAHVINEAVQQILPTLLERWEVVHQCGDSQAYKDYDALVEEASKLPEWLQKHYHLEKFVTGDDIGYILNKADLIVTRSGANIVTEIAALGKSALFIPLPYSYGGEQHQNAKLLVDAGVAEILPQSQLAGEKLLVSIWEMMENLPKYQKNSDQAKSLVRLDAAQKLADEIAKLGSRL